MPDPSDLPRLHLDANAILRYLRRDNREQSDAVRARLSEARAGRLAVEVHILIVAEVIYVLESFYEESRQRIASVMLTFLDTPGLHFSEKSLLREALHRYHDTNVSFVDAFLAALGAGTSYPVFSFDRGLDKFKDIRRIEK
jgi:predicted nucleic-acid-binding protein